MENKWNRIVDWLIPATMVMANIYLLLMIIKTLVVLTSG